MLRKLFLSSLFLLVFLPVNSWAISSVTYDLGGYSHGHLKNFSSKGWLTGSWNGNGLKNISGWFGGDYGSFDINSGYLKANGAGKLNVSIFQKNKIYHGNIFFKDYGYGFNNTVSDSYLDLWGGSWLGSYKLKKNGSIKWQGHKWVGLDLWGPSKPPVAVPEPATFGLMGLGLLGFAFARKKQNVE